MSLHKASWLAVGIAVTGLAVAASRLAGAAAPPTPDLVNNEGIFVDLKTFKITRGMAKTDPAAQIARLGARPATEGAIIFRSDDQLYLVDAVPGGMAMNLRFEGAFGPPG